ncbi:MAG TPA: four helix bundle protein [Sedimentisphaerales bacterium]|jgi:four helix bundle protein|nr:four helix bundle protein [Sedimentisphaerales bacterium]
MAEAGYEKLLAWQKADELAYQIYLATRTFPKEELYGMTSQIRRAGLSMPTNLVEGYARQGKKEFRQFVNIALGSLAEAKYLLGFALRLTYLKPEAHRHLHGQAEEVGRLLWKFYQSLGAKP